MYLVTGCAGFIASRVCSQLLDAGHSVLGVDNLNDAYDPALKQWRLELLEHHPNFTFKTLDIADPSSVTRLLDGHSHIQAILNLAARAGVRASCQNPQVYLDTNITGTLNLLELCRRHSIPRFVLASTSSLYAGSQQLPFHESDPANRPLSPYAASKKAAEAIAYSYHHLYNIHVAVPRYFTVYGPLGRPDMSVFRFVRQMVEDQPLQLYGDGTQQRDFTFVDDIARGTIACLHVDGFQPINLGGSQTRSINHLIHCIAQAVNTQPKIERHPFHRADMPTTWADNSRAAELLGWQPQVSLEDGVRRCVDWYLENRQRARTIQLGD